jgi:hypothetical protein
VHCLVVDAPTLPGATNAVDRSVRHVDVEQDVGGSPSSSTCLATASATRPALPKSKRPLPEPRGTSPRASWEIANEGTPRIVASIAAAMVPE